MKLALRAGGVRGVAKALLIVAKVTTEARTELRKSTALTPWEGSLRCINWGGLAADKRVRA